MSQQTVVAATQPMTKQQLHAKLMSGWARGIDRHGKGTFADKLDCSTEGLNKQLSGSFPSFETLDKAFDAEPTVLDDWLTAKGKRVVDANAVCDVDDASLLISRLLVKLHEAEHPESPGGRAVVHTELLGMESLIRELHGATGNWIAEIDQIRSPSLRSVA